MVTLVILFQDSEPDIIDGVGAEAGQVIRTTIGGRNGQPKQVGKNQFVRNIDFPAMSVVFVLDDKYFVFSHRVLFVDRLLVT